MAAKAKAKDDGEPFFVEVRQTAIKVYPVRRGGSILPTEYQFRYYIGDEQKRVTRANRDAIIKEAKDVATKIENGKMQAGEMTAADIQSWAHARRQLPADSPPLHVIVEEWQRFRGAAPGMTLDHVAALWKRSQPRNGQAHAPGASLVASLKEAMLQSLEQTAQASGTRRNVDGFRQDLARFARVFGQRPVAEISTDEIQTWLRGLGVGARRQDNLRAELVTFFHFARDRGHLPADQRVEPDKVPTLFKSSGDVAYYRPSELRKFLQCADPAPTAEKQEKPFDSRKYLAHPDRRWLPFLAIAAFTGMRSSEIGRLEWSDFDWHERRIYVPATKALKVRRRRRVPISDNLFAWLLPWQDQTGKLYPQRHPDKNWAKYTKRLATAAGIQWRNNNLRHSYGTYQMAQTDNAGTVAAWMGNSATVVKNNYDGVASPKEAKEWFAIAPDRAASSNVIALRREAV